MRRVCLLMALLSPGLLEAQWLNPPTAGVTQWEAGVFGGYRWSGELMGFETQFGGRWFEIELDGGPAFGVSIAAPIGGVHQIELWASRRSAEMEPQVNLQGALGEIEITYLHLTALRHWYTRRDTATYVGLGVGATMLDPEIAGTQSSTHPSASVFMGAKYFLTRSMLLRADLRGYWTYGDEDLSESVGNVRFGYPDDLLQVEASVGFSLVF